MICLEFIELSKGGLKSRLIKFGFESKVIEMGSGAVDFEFDESHQRGKNVVLLRVRAFGR